VSTTTLGVGEDYNEDLMEAMANTGDGNYYFIESPAQLADIFQTELKGLSAVVGQRVSLGVEPEKATVADVLNDLEKAPTGRLMLPNLSVGMPVTVLIRLSVPASSGVTPICTARLAWDPPGGKRQTLQAELTLPAVPKVEWDTLPEHPTVREREALLMAARAHREAVRALERGDLVGTRECLDMAFACTAAAPASAATAEELQAIQAQMQLLEAGQHARYAKVSKFRAYSRRRDKPTS
jgi:Ca-activated chloride channel family protein